MSALTAALFAALGGAQAQAAPLLIFDQEPDPSLYERMAVDGADVEALEPTMLPRDLGRAPLFSGGALAICASPAPLDLGATLHEVDGALNYGEYERAADALDAGAAGMACADAVVDPAQAARVHFLQGVVAERDGRADAARAAFAIALRFQPDYAWEDDLPMPPSAKALFESVAARPATATASLRVLPADAEVWVDGRRHEASAPVATGDHLIQVVEGGAVRPMSASIQGDASLILPGALPDDVVAWTDDPERRAELAALAAAAAGGDALAETVYAIDGGQIWRIDPDGGWYELPPVPASQTGGRVRTALLWPGVGALVAGGAGSLYLYASGMQMYNACIAAIDDGDHGACDTDEEDYGLRQKGLWVTNAVAVGGGAAVGLSFIVDGGRYHLGPRWVAGQPGVALSWTPAP